MGIRDWDPRDTSPGTETGAATQNEKVGTRTGLKIEKWGLETEKIKSGDPGLGLVEFYAVPVRP